MRQPGEGRWGGLAVATGAMMGRDEGSWRLLVVHGGYGDLTENRDPIFRIALKNLKFSLVKNVSRGKPLSRFSGSCSGPLRVQKKPAPRTAKLTRCGRKSSENAKNQWLLGLGLTDFLGQSAWF